MRRNAVALLALVLLSFATHAQEKLTVKEAGIAGEYPRIRDIGGDLLSPKAGSLAFVFHDGSFENGYSFNTIYFPEFVERVFLPASDGSLTVLQACFVTLFTYLPGELDVEYVVYSVAGSGGPGVELGSLPITNTETVFPATHTCFTTGIAPFAVDSQIYFGARWDGLFESDVYISADENGPSYGAGFGRRHGLDSGWGQLGTPSLFPSYRNLGIGLAWTPGPTIFADGFESGSTTAWSQTN